MAVTAVDMTVAGVPVLVEAVTVAGTEPTSRAGRVAADAFDHAREAIVAVATTAAGVVGDLARGAVTPQQVEVEFGVKFTLKGNVIVAKGGGEATLLVRLTYAAPAGESA